MERIQLGSNLGSEAYYLQNLVKFLQAPTVSSTNITSCLAAVIV